MEILRTPDERFENLQDYDFTPHYTTIKDKDGTDIRIHHVDEGNPEGKPILMMHGNPTRYLHRMVAGSNRPPGNLGGSGGLADLTNPRAKTTAWRAHDWTVNGCSPRQQISPGWTDW